MSSYAGSETGDHMPGVYTGAQEMSYQQSNTDQPSSAWTQPHAPQPAVAGSYAHQTALGRH